MIRGTYLALEHMKKDNGGNGGVIVNVASLAGLLLMLQNFMTNRTKYKGFLSDHIAKTNIKLYFHVDCRSGTSATKSRLHSD